MRKLLLALAFCALPSVASAQCNGIFNANSLCGSILGGPPAQVPISSISPVFGTGSPQWPQFETSFTQPTVLTVLQGSPASPVTNGTPTAGASRYEALNLIDEEGGANAAFYAVSVGNNVSDVTHNSQTSGITGKAFQNGSGDVAGGFFIGFENGPPAAGVTHTAFGMFAQAYAAHNPSNGFGAEIGVVNSTGVAWTRAMNLTTGGGAALHLGPAGLNNVGAGIWLTGAVGGGNNSQFDAGIKFDATSVATVVIDVASSATGDVLQTESGTTFANGTDYSASTFSGSPFKSPGFNIDATGNGHFAAGSAATPSITSSATTTTGFYFPAASRVGFSAAGTNVFDYNITTANSFTLNPQGGGGANALTIKADVSSNQLDIYLNGSGSASSIIRFGTLIIPDSDNLYLIGFPGFAWKDIFTNQIQINTGAALSLTATLISASPNTGTPGAAPATWTSAYSIFGANATSLTGAALGLGYDTTDNAGIMICATPGTGWQPCYFQASQYRFLANGAAPASPSFFIGSGVNVGGTTDPGTGVIQAQHATLTSLTTGTNADFLCLSSGGVVLLQASACTISSLRFKPDWKPYDNDALQRVSNFEVGTFHSSVVSRDHNSANLQAGLNAENIAKVAPECAIYEDDGVTPKSYRQECVIALLVRSVQQIKQDKHL